MPKKRPGQDINITRHLYYVLNGMAQDGVPVEHALWVACWSTALTFQTRVDPEEIISFVKKALAMHGKGD
jgi:hypothetical protein